MNKVLLNPEAALAYVGEITKGRPHHVQKWFHSTFLKWQLNRMYAPNHIQCVSESESNSPTFKMLRALTETLPPADRHSFRSVRDADLRLDINREALKENRLWAWTRPSPDEAEEYLNWVWYASAMEPSVIADYHIDRMQMESGKWIRAQKAAFNKLVSQP